MTRLAVEWRNRVAAEYRSASIASHVLTLGIGCGLPRSLLKTASRIVEDELDHAELSHAVLTEVGNVHDPVSIDVRTLLPPACDDALLALTDVVLRDFCFGETFAVPLFRAMWRHTTRPTALRALDRILRDEAVHRRFGYDMLDALLEIDLDGVRLAVQDRLAPNYAQYRRAFFEVEGPALTELERSYGLLDAAGYRRGHDQAAAYVARALLRRHIG